MGKRPPSKGWNECGFYIERTPDFGSNLGVGVILLQEGQVETVQCFKFKAFLRRFLVLSRLFRFD